MTINELKSRGDVPVVEADEQGLILWVNSEFEKVFGWKRSEIVGMPLTNVIPERLRDAHNVGFSRFVMGGQSKIMGQHLRLQAVRKDGSEFEAEHYILAERNERCWSIVASMKPL